MVISETFQFTAEENIQLWKQLLPKKNYASFAIKSGYKNLCD